LRIDPIWRRIYADAHADNWERIRRVCTAYSIRPFFVLQPTSLDALFPNGLRKDDRSLPLQANLYANYLVYEELRKTAQAFSEAHPELGVLDLSSFLPSKAFFDGAHVYDDVNDHVAGKLADFIANDIERMR
jgi:hypothetical protein